MKASEFINLNLKYGQRVRVTFICGTFEGFFGGYKTFDGNNMSLKFALNPIFYAIGRKGQMIKRSMVPNHTPYWGFSQILRIGLM